MGNEVHLLLHRGRQLRFAKDLYGRTAPFDGKIIRMPLERCAHARVGITREHVSSQLLDGGRRRRDLEARAIVGRHLFEHRGAVTPAVRSTRRRMDVTAAPSGCAEKRQQHSGQDQTRHRHHRTEREAELATSDGASQAPVNGAGRPHSRSGSGDPVHAGLEVSIRSFVRVRVLRFGLRSPVVRSRFEGQPRGRGPRASLRRLTRSRLRAGVRVSSGCEAVLP